jgi:hypothetical protein
MYLFIYLTFLDNKYEVNVYTFLIGILSVMDYCQIILQIVCSLIPFRESLDSWFCTVFEF